jgi:hypothetical protein
MRVYKPFIDIELKINAQIARSWLYLRGQAQIRRADIRSC